MAKIFGIDLSYHNGTVDFEKVKAEGVEFVILRCGYASTSNRNSYGKDTKFETYYKDAKAAGLAVGSYFYSRCNDNATAKAEAEFILKCIAGKSFEYPIWLDVEDQSTLSSANKETMTTAIETCLDTIKNAGYKVGIYTGVYIVRDNLIQSRIDKYDVWIAQWASSCSYTGNLCMWQFGGETNKLRSVKINGVSSAACDQNYSAIDYAAGEESTGQNNPFTGDEITSGGTGGNGGTGGGSSGITGPGNLYLTFNNTTTAQESLPNANVSDNWVDMHRIKGITLHMYPPYHNCKADSMANYFKALGWDRNFHYKVDKDTKVDFSKKPASGSTTGGNKVGSSVSDFEITPKDPLNTGVTITGDENGVYIENAGSNGGSGGSGGGGGDTGTPSAPGTPIEGSNVATKIYNYCVSQGCSCAAACGIVGNAQRESGFDPTLLAYDGSGSIGLFQWLATRRTALEKAAQTAGVSYKDADFQIQYMWSEWTSSYYMNQLKKQYNMTLSDFKALSSPEKAATIFERIFEVSAENTKLREQYAREWYNKFSVSSSSAEFLEAEILTDEILYYELPETSDEPFGWPVPGQEYVQSNYGYRQDVLGYRYHPGIDIVNMAGYGAYCYADGRVEKVLTNSVLSGYVRVNHGNGLETIYGSLQTIHVEEGEKVVGGQCIGLTNITDANSLMHLHFGMKINNQYVDPLYYVQPGGGNKAVPDCYYGVTTFDVTDTNENITWDNVDKGKICFASAENNTHTYIDANLFNNQHAKYTLSIGSFFYDEFDLVEKSKEVDYPATEKILIEQTAKALYDEGFTSQQLWREFDLNRAPSPFLYLDKDKWVAFCAEVDKQVEWLNKKYGIVTATYKPNELLENKNKNEFVETAPGGASGSTGGGGGGGGDTGGGEDTGGVTNPGSGSLGWPVPGISTIISKFGKRKAPTAGASTDHKGIDIPGPTGTTIVAADSGKVVLAKTGNNWGRGTYMVIDHGNGLGTLYQHLSKITASLGSSVSKGDKIAEMGNTGISTGSHLHFEVHTGFSGTKGTPVDPEKYVSAGKSSVGDFTIMANVQDGGAGSPQIDVSFPEDENSYTGLHLSGLGASSIDNGGVMEYSVADPEDKNAKQPEIETIITQEEYYAIMEYATSGQIDLYANSFEPYDKDLDIAKTIGLQNDARLSTLTEVLRTLTENIIRYIVVETGPGSIDHCVKPVDELSTLFMISDCMCDPIYPDLIIPPKYVTSAYDALSQNSIPMRTVEDATITLEDALDKSYSYDYELLDEVTKETTGKPINYYDPYPYDDKITDLENHLPKVLIDEIESRVYSCNHPGCPIAHPMAKNFAMLNDMAINQSKYTEQRLVQIENVLATMVRYLGRMSSRMNINCVYYGGQTVMGKYKCIRCLRDNRIQDGATVTIDQCLSCTRYEPIIGQVYDILDETGFNGSAILDDMQMSYMSLDDMKNLNLVEKRNTTYNYADTNKKEEEIPKSLIEEWKEKDLAKYKEENNITSDDEIAPSKYLFMMDWNRQAFDLQRPDVKDYPTEAISAKYYDQAGDPGEEVEEKTPAEKLADLFTPKEVYDKLAEGEWVDTRQEDDNMEINRYTSLDYYFENFNKNRTGYEYDNGLVGNVGLETTGGPGGSDWGMEGVSISGGYNNGGGGNNGNNDIKDSVNGTGSEIRNKIVEYAYKVVQQNKDKEATYCGTHRTVDPDKLVRHGGSRNGCSNPICYDCTGLVSAAYRYAGLSSFYNKNASGGSLVAEALSNSAQIWEGNKAGFEKALPGDIIMVTNSKISNFDPKNPPSTYHAMIYTSTNEVSHASGNYEPGKAIKTQTVKYNDSHYGGKMFFVRCKELITADAKAESSSSSGNVVFEEGTIDGNKYVCILNNARCTEYGPWDGSGTTVATGKSWSSVVNKSVASHNLPYGTKIYIPSLKGKVNSTGIFTVEDTGGYCFDFDVATSKSSGVTGFRKAYILSYGSGKTSASFTYGRKVVDPNGTKYATAWKTYMTHGGCLIHFSKFNDEDAKADWWK